MRLLVVAYDVPYPADRGGRADIWRRLVALNGLDCATMLVCWHEAGASSVPTPEQTEVIQQRVETLRIYPIRRGPLEALARLARLYSAPSHATGRRVEGQDWGELLETARKFRPEAMWLEGPYGGLVARRLSAALSTPIFYRSHNIEHLYMARQSAAARSLRNRMAWKLACIGLARFERGLMDQARYVFDVSVDDMRFWKEQGISKIGWLPPLPEAALMPAKAPAVTKIQHDVLFLGNLMRPNNVRGIEFLVGEVIPRVLAQRPHTRFTIAGSNPLDSVRQLVATQRAVTLLENVADALALLYSAKVLVNPVRTGSGIHVKALDMLMTDAPIVSSHQGTYGMPEEVKRLFRVHDDAEGFAQAILQELERPSTDLAARARARRFFSRDAISAILEQMEETVGI
jgi:glycosyltransferase involved in cell wall biosynthesis